MMDLEHYLRQASEGSCILLIGKDFRPFSAIVNRGALYIRGHALSGLKSVAVNEVVLFGDTPKEVAELAAECIRSFPNSRITKRET